MPAFAYTLEPAQVDQIIAFLKIAPARAPAAPLDETAP
jgi:hypothetical protein